MSNAAKTPQSLPGADYSRTLRDIRRLIYLYLFLLIIEGGFAQMDRSAIFQSVAAGARSSCFGDYFLAWRAHIFPRNGFILWLSHHRHSFLDRFHFRSRSLCADVAHSSRYGLRIPIKLSASSSRFHLRECVRRR